MNQLPAWANWLLGGIGAIILERITDAFFPRSSFSLKALKGGWRGHQLRHAKHAAGMAQLVLHRPEFALGAGLSCLTWTVALGVLVMMSLQQFDPHDTSLWAGFTSLAAIVVMISFVANFLTALHWFHRYANPEAYVDRANRRLERLGIRKDAPLAEQGAER